MRNGCLGSEFQHVEISCCGMGTGSVRLSAQLVSLENSAMLPLLGFTPGLSSKEEHLVQCARVSGGMTNEAERLAKEKAQKLLNPLTRLGANLDKKIAKR